MLARHPSANRVDLSSGGSDSAIDTDSYLESLIKKQKIPRTKQYNPSGRFQQKPEPKAPDDPVGPVNSKGSQGGTSIIKKQL